MQLLKLPSRENIQHQNNRCVNMKRYILIGQMKQYSGTNLGISDTSVHVFVLGRREIKYNFQHIIVSLAQVIVSMYAHVCDSWQKHTNTCRYIQIHTMDSDVSRDFLWLRKCILFSEDPYFYNNCVGHEMAILVFVTHLEAFLTGIRLIHTCCYQHYPCSTT